jgi:hypothetical protein
MRGDEMNNLLGEQRLSFCDLARREGINVSTVWRWALKGARGSKLESFSVGARRFTTFQAFERFAEHCTAAAKGRPSVRASEQRESAMMQAERELAERGV